MAVPSPRRPFSASYAFIARHLSLFKLELISSSRNTEYLRKVILQLLDAGVVPILATKADNREKDERINRDMSMLAAEYDLPLWNFWAALSDLPGRGLYVMQGREAQGPVYLNDEASVRHRMTGLETLDVVWRAVTADLP